MKTQLSPTRPRPSQPTVPNRTQPNPTLSRRGYPGRLYRLCGKEDLGAGGVDRPVQRTASGHGERGHAEQCRRGRGG